MASFLEWNSVVSDVGRDFNDVAIEERILVERGVLFFKDICLVLWRGREFFLIGLDDSMLLSVRNKDELVFSFVIFVSLFLDLLNLLQMFDYYNFITSDSRE